MKREKAIINLKEILYQYKSSLEDAQSKFAEKWQKESIKDNKEAVEALQMAIKALEQEPCEDCISRQAVLDMLENINAETEGVGFYYEHYVEYIKNL